MQKAKKGALMPLNIKDSTHGRVLFLLAVGIRGKGSRYEKRLVEDLGVNYFCFFGKYEIEWNCKSYPNAKER